MKLIAYTVGTVVGIAYSATIGGFTLVKIWDWFMVPAFGLPHLTIPLAIGVAIVAGHLTHQMTEAKSEEYLNELLKLVIGTTIRCLITLLVGFVTKLFI